MIYFHLWQPGTFHCEECWWLMYGILFLQVSRSCRKNIRMDSYCLLQPWKWNIAIRQQNKKENLADILSVLDAFKNILLTLFLWCLYICWFMLQTHAILFLPELDMHLIRAPDSISIAIAIVCLFKSLPLIPYDF